MNEYKRRSGGVDEWNLERVRRMCLYVPPNEESK
jgi:hypothetical protein